MDNITEREFISLVLIACGAKSSNGVLDIENVNLDMIPVYAEKLAKIYPETAENVQKFA